VFDGEDNPLVTGLFGFEYCTTYSEVVEALGKAVEERGKKPKSVPDVPENLELHLQFGRKIFAATLEENKVEGVIEILMEMQTRKL
jgi:hypothetical protein